MKTMFEVCMILIIVFFLLMGLYYWIHESQQNQRIKRLEKKVFDPEELLSDAEREMLEEQEKILEKLEREGQA